MTPRPTTLEGVRGVGMSSWDVNVRQETKREKSLMEESESGGKEED